MDIEAIRKKMNEYFNNVSPDAVVEEFVKRGYTLDPCPPESLSGITAYYTTYAHPLGHNGLFEANKRKKQGKNLAFFMSIFL